MAWFRRFRRFGRLRRGRRIPEPELRDDGTLVVVAESWDPAVADSLVLSGLEGSGTLPAGRALVRHHLVVPDEAAVQEIQRVLADESYAVTAEVDAGGGWRVRASRAEQLSAMTLAQQRSRMAGLAQRLGGEALGWDALGAPVQDVGRR